MAKRADQRPASESCSNHSEALVSDVFSCGGRGLFCPSLFSAVGMFMSCHLLPTIASL